MLNGFQHALIEGIMSALYELAATFPQEGFPDPILQGRQIIEGQAMNKDTYRQVNQSQYWQKSNPQIAGCTLTHQVNEEPAQTTSTVIEVRDHHYSLTVARHLAEDGTWVPSIGFAMAPPGLLPQSHFQVPGEPTGVEPDAPEPLIIVAKEMPRAPIS